MEKLSYNKTFHKRTFLTLLLILFFIWSLFSVNWGSELIHSGGKSTMLQILNALFHPDLSPKIIKLGFIAAWRTLAYAVSGMTLAIVFAFIFGVLASGILANNNNSRLFTKTIFRSLLGFMRAIHELVWAWLFVASVGLSPYAAIFALAIPYGGTLGRIYADILSDVPKEPILALKTSGASKLQLLFYGYLPLAKNDMISYTMYRFECAVRSSTIMSFVGLGGLGYQIQLSLQDLRYNEVWTFMFFLTALVFLIDLWSNLLRKALSDSKSKHKFNIIHFSFLSTVLLVIICWLFIIKVDKADFWGLFSEKNMRYSKKFLGGLMGESEKTPAFMDAESWKTALKLTYETVQMSVMAIGFAAIGMFLTVIPAARNVANGSLTLTKTWYSKLLFLMIRFLYIFTRAVPELVWAMIIIFIFKPGILPGAIALSLHNFGILGKLCAEVVEDLDMLPIRNLASCGANKGQLLIYGVIPMAMPKFLSYIVYRFEVILRTTIVVGFVGAGGLGQQFKLSMSFFHYSDITLILICYLFLVLLSDLISEGSRIASR
jgi:phosphonate transport system permease protein